MVHGVPALLGYQRQSRFPVRSDVDVGLLPVRDDLIRLQGAPNKNEKKCGDRYA
jgi:hypothetical protein